MLVRNTCSSYYTNHSHDYLKQTLILRIFLGKFLRIFFVSYTVIIWFVEQTNISVSLVLMILYISTSSHQCLKINGAEYRIELFEQCWVTPRYLYLHTFYINTNWEVANVNINVIVWSNIRSQRNIQEKIYERTLHWSSVLVSWSRVWNSNTSH